MGSDDVRRRLLEPKAKLVYWIRDNLGNAKGEGRCEVPLIMPFLEQRRFSKVKFK